MHVPRNTARPACAIIVLDVCGAMSARRVLALVDVPLAGAAPIADGRLGFVGAAAA